MSVPLAWHVALPTPATTSGTDRRRWGHPMGRLGRGSWFKGPLASRTSAESQSSLKKWVQERESRTAGHLEVPI